MENHGSDNSDNADNSVTPARLQGIPVGGNEAVSFEKKRSLKERPAKPIC
jgi:hypothetical protein